MAKMSMTLSDLQSHSTTGNLLKFDFSYNCTSLDNISTEIARRAVPLR